MFGNSAPERFSLHPNRFIRSAMSLALLASLFTGISFSSADAASNGLVFFVRQNAAVATNTLTKDAINASSANYCGSATLTSINFTSWASGITCNFSYSQSYASGFIKAPFSGLVTLTTSSDDGVKVQVNDYVGIDNWTDNGVAADSMSLPMVAGNYYPIKIWYANGPSTGVLTLSWSYGVQSSITIPSGSFYQSTADFDSCPLRSGIGPNCAGSSALQIKQLTNVNADGLYWIDLGDGSGAKATYSIMNSAQGGGGWMLAMKGRDSGSELSYSSTYWKDAILLNSDRPSRNNQENVDGKYLPFTQSKATDVMVIFPDYPANAVVGAGVRGGAYPSSGDGFAWSENMANMRAWTSADGTSWNVNQGGDPSGTSACATYPSTMQTIFSNSSRCLIRGSKVNASYNASSNPYDPIGNELFYSQKDIRFFGFNYASASAGSVFKARFGFGWNENGDTNEESNDGTGGLGLQNSSGMAITSGTRNVGYGIQGGISGGPNTETNFGFELFVKNTTTLTISGATSFRPQLGTSATTTYSVNGGNTPVFSLSPVISGLSINSSSGVLTAANSLALGTYYETVTVVNSLGASGVRPVTIQVVSGSASSDTAMRFTGTNYLASGTESEFDVSTGTTFTLSAWVNPTTVSGGRIIASKNGQYSIYINNGLFGFNMIGVPTGGGGYGIDPTSAPARTNQWQHVALTRNGNTIKFLINGQQIYSDSSLSPTNVITGGSNQFTIGGIASEAYFVGQIDQVLLSSSDRSGSIQSDMNTHQPSDAGLIAHYDFNEGTSSTVFNRKSGSSSTTDLTLNTGSNSWASIETTTVSAPYTTVTFPRTYLTSNGGWTTPAGVTKATAIVVGGGGGGGKGTSSSAGPAGAGGGGGVSYTGALTLTPSTSAAVKVGMGGVGAFTITNDATTRNGQSSEFNNGSSIVALGGGGGGSEGAFAPAGSGVSDTTIATGGGASGSGYTSGGCSGFNSAGGVVSSGYNGGRGSWGWGGAGGGARGAGSNGICGNNEGLPGAGFIDPVTSREYGRGGYSSYYLANINSGLGTPNIGWGGSVAYNEGQASGNGYPGSSGVVVIRYLNISVPSFTSLPSADTTTAGRTYSFAASGSPLSPMVRSYLWQSSTNSGSTWSPISGANTETYTTSTLETTTSGSQFRYRVVVTDTDTAGNLISDTSTAFLVINPRITISGTTSFSRSYGTDTSTATFTFANGTGTRTPTFAPNNRTGIAWSSTSSSGATLTIGKYLTAGTYYETMTVTDSVSAVTNQMLTITVTAAGAVTVQVDTVTALTYGATGLYSPTSTITGLVNGEIATAANRVTYSYTYTGVGTTCATGGFCSVGDLAPGGGYVFYVSDTVINAASGISTGGLYLATAPKTWNGGATDPTAPWGCGGTTLSGSFSNLTGSGAENTKLITASCATAGIAARRAADLTFAGYSDWFLPSLDELTFIYSYLKTKGLSDLESWNYWSSTQSTSNAAGSAKYWWFGAGATNGETDKNNSAASNMYLRPIRAFSPAVTTASVLGITNAGTYVITPSALSLDSPASTANYTTVNYSPATLIVNKAAQTKISLVQNYTAAKGTPRTLVQVGGSGTGSRTETLTASSLAAGCSLSGLTLTVNPTTITSCDVVTSKALDTNYLADSATVTVYLLEFVLNIPQGNVGGGGEIGLNGQTAFQTLASSPPTVSSYTNSAGVGATLSFVGTGFTSGFTVTFQAAGGGEVTATMNSVTSTTFSCVVPVGAISGPIIVRNNIGIKRLSFTVSP